MLMRCYPGTENVLFAKPHSRTIMQSYFGQWPWRARRLNASSVITRDSGILTTRDSGILTTRDSGILTTRDSGILTKLVSILLMRKTCSTSQNHRMIICSEWLSSQNHKRRPFLDWFDTISKNLRVSKQVICVVQTLTGKNTVSIRKKEKQTFRKKSSDF